MCISTHSQELSISESLREKRERERESWFLPHKTVATLMY